MLRIQHTLQNTRILATAGVLVIALFALPIVTNQPLPSDQETQTRSTDQPVPTRVSYQPGTVVLGVGERTCALAPASDQAALALGPDCEEVAARLSLPESGTIWLSLTLSDQPDLWLPLNLVAGDPAPPQLDQRGRYFGCTQASEQVCQVKVEIDAATYQVAIPLALDTE